MKPRERRAVRALLLSRRGEILLMRFHFPAFDRLVWLTPGGAMQPGETPIETLERELLEETGLRATAIGAELWRRDHLLEFDGESILQRERYYLVEVDRFEPSDERLEDGNERDWFRGYRWWPLGDLPERHKDFAPTQIGALARGLVNAGPPSAPIQIGV